MVVTESFFDDHDGGGGGSPMTPHVARHNADAAHHSSKSDQAWSSHVPPLVFAHTAETGSRQNLNVRTFEDTGNGESGKESPAGSDGTADGRSGAVNKRSVKMLKDLKENKVSGELYEPVDNSQTNILLERGWHLPRPQFDWVIFLKQLMYHFLAPLSTPLMMMMEGKTLVTNQAFLPESGKPWPWWILFVNYGMPLLVGMCDVLYLYQLIFTSRGSHVYVVEIAMLNSFHLLRHIMIAVKYAFVMSDSWWKDRLTSVVNPKIIESLLLTLWVNPSPVTIEREIRIAEERIGVRLSTRELFKGSDSHQILNYGLQEFKICEINKMMERQQRSMSGNLMSAAELGKDSCAPVPPASSSPSSTYDILSRTDSLGSDLRRMVKSPSAQSLSSVVFDPIQDQCVHKNVNMMNISAYDYMKKLISSLEMHPPGVWMRVIAAGLALLPTVWRLIHKIFWVGVLDTIVITVSTILIFILAGSILNFLVAGYMDYRRRVYLTTALTMAVENALKEPKARELQKLKTDPCSIEGKILALNLPDIDFTLPVNVTTYSVLSSFVQNYGLEYKRRCQLYLSSVVLLVALMEVAIVIRALTYPDANTFSGLEIVYTQLLFVISCGFLFGITTQAIAHNSSYERQRHLLLSLRLRMKHAMSRIMKNMLQYRRLEDAADMLGDVATMAHVEREMGALRVIGIAASGTSLRGIFALLLSLLGFTLNLLFQQTRM